MRRWRTAVLLGLLAACGGEEAMRMPPPEAPRGELEVRWTLEDPEGEPLDCDDVRIAEATVAIGGDPVAVPCGDEPVVRFAEILPGRLPVVIRQLSVIGLVIAERLDNVEILSGQTTEYTHTFVIDDGTSGTGSLELRWSIDGISAARRCATVGAAAVRVEALPSSIADLEVEAPCDDGVVVVDEVRGGGYDFLFHLLDEDGATISTGSAINVAVLVGRTTIASVRFDTIEEPPARLHSTWTVTGSAAVDACPAVLGERVEVSFQAIRSINGAFEEVATASAACDAGALTMSDVPVFFEHRTVMELFDTFDRVIAIETTDDVPIETGSATVAVDFVPAK